MKILFTFVLQQVSIVMWISVLYFQDEKLLSGQLLTLNYDNDYYQFKYFRW